MKLRLFLCLLIIICTTSFTLPVSKNNAAGTPCISAEEKKLFDQINAYRRKHKLPAVPLSASLTIVAQAHVKDLSENYSNPLSNNCNLHSWSSKGKWSACCYTGDHKKASCMWDKPRELTSYKGDGYEVAYYNTGTVTAEDALKGWKTSKMGHNDMLLNTSIWKTVKWKAIGVAIKGNYAVAWFGRDTDSLAAPALCH